MRMGGPKHLLHSWQGFLLSSNRQACHSCCVLVWKLHSWLPEHLDQLLPESTVWTCTYRQGAETLEGLKQM